MMLEGNERDIAEYEVNVRGLPDPCIKPDKEATE